METSDWRHCKNPRSNHERKKQERKKKDTKAAIKVPKYGMVSFLQMEKALWNLCWFQNRSHSLQQCPHPALRKKTDIQIKQNGSDLRYTERSTSTVVTKPVVDTKSDQSNGFKPTTAKAVAPDSPTARFDDPRIQPSHSKIQGMNPLSHQRMSKTQPVVQEQELVDLEGETLVEDFETHAAS